MSVELMSEVPQWVSDTPVKVRHRGSRVFDFILSNSQVSGCCLLNPVETGERGVVKIVTMTFWFYRSLTVMS